MTLEEGLDTGPVHTCVRVPIGSTVTADELRARLARDGTDLLVRHASATAFRRRLPQVGEPTYATKLDASELALDWTRPAAELDRLVRVGRAWTTFRGTRLLVLGATPRPVDPSPGPGVLRRACASEQVRACSSFATCSRKGAGRCRSRRGATGRASRTASDSDDKPGRHQRQQTRGRWRSMHWCGSNATAPTRTWLFRPRSRAASSPIVIARSRPSSSTARCACGGRAIGSPTASFAIRRTSRPARRFASARTSSRFSAPRLMRPWARPSRWLPSTRGRS